MNALHFLTDHIWYVIGVVLAFIIFLRNNAELQLKR